MNGGWTHSVGGPWALIAAVTLCFSLACEAGAKRPIELQGVSKPTGGGQSGLEGVCGRMEGGGGEPLGADETIFGLNLTPQSVAKRAQANTDSAYQWRPWWLAPQDAPASEVPLSIEVRWHGVARAVTCPPGAELDVSIALADEVGEVQLRGDGRLLVTATSEGSGAPEQISLLAELDAPDLSEKLALPPAAPSSIGADRFRLEAILEEDGWQGGVLSSVREGNACELLRFPARAEEPCDRYLPTLSGDEPVQQIELDAVVANGVSANDAIAAFEPLSVQSLTWPGGDRTSLRVVLEPLGFACSASREVSDTPIAGGASSGPNVHVQELLVPVRAHATTDDGRLGVTLDSMLSRFLSENREWDGKTRVLSLPTTASALDAAGAKVDLPRADTGLALFSFWIEPLADELNAGSVALFSYTPYPGAPPFPNVVDQTNRVHCFGAFRSVERAGLGR